MMSSESQKSWVSPIVAVACVAVVLTGLLMMFHVHWRGVHPLHLWSGVLFGVAVTVHLLLNWRVFVSYFKNGRVVLMTACGMLLSILILVAVPSKGKMDRHHRGSGPHLNAQAQPRQ